MQSATLTKIIDLLSFIVLVAMISTGALLEFTLPARSGPLSVWGMTRHEWGDLHSNISLVFLVLLSAHLLLHLKFIKYAVTGSATTEQKYRIAIGIAGLIALLAVAFAPVVSPVEEPAGARPGHQFNRR